MGRLRPAPAAHHLSILPTSLLNEIAAKAVGLWFDEVTAFVARVDQATLGHMWSAVSETTRPVLAGSAWRAELATMSVIGAAVALPLVCAAVIQAVVRQDLGGLVRTALVRLPLALLFSTVAAQLVTLGLRATDQACLSLLHAAGSPLSSLEGRMATALAATGPGLLGANFIFLVLAGLMALVVWLELAVRSAAVAAATLFLPLALAGSAFPATAHWARRLAETLAALVLSKLAIVAVLTLAAGSLGSVKAGIAGLLEGITLLGLAAVAPLALARMLPMIEAGAIAHLDGLGRHSVSRAARVAGGTWAWMGSSVSKTMALDGEEHGGGLGHRGAGPGSGTGPLNVPMRAPTPPREPSRPSRGDANREGPGASPEEGVS